ncbi:MULTISPECIES: GMC family oxidoreductase [Streptomyces]|uniref:GMC family oxidoreductase n=2 Tax=Streptomyces TaxID=1883 RepID=A0A2U9NWC3_STRAS|nr:GMC family oxidoreductase [Streptomyces actuosus]AWT41135.1 GMC family oxidoreductase [Streptomyces actuosus]MBM4826351.1 GMC family oxidoreductase [Streptomyces actuosus]
MYEKFPEGAAQRTDPAVAADDLYDAVIVGGGISGALIAARLSQAGRRVLILEAGPAEDLTLRGYEDYLNRFYEAISKDNQAPYPALPNAPMPRGTDVRPIVPGAPDASAYLVQNGPFATDTTYTRVLGGTTMHWEGKTLRMLPEDFRMRSLYGEGADWPLSYDDLAPYYSEAEREIGVSADVEDQAYLGITFDDDYVFPMKGLPLSYLDRTVAKDIDGMEVELDGVQRRLRVRPFPQGRNGIANPDYDGGKGYVPQGAVSAYQVEVGERCQGNNNCVPICPVQAKYNAGKTLAVALRTGRVDMVGQAVAHKVHIDERTRRVTEIEYRRYDRPDSPGFTTMTARGRLFVLAANAVENPRLMLASGLRGSSGLMGRNFMDHAYLLAWGLLPEPAGTFRGTVCTGGIADLRGGRFRSRQAAFTIDIHNDGWGWARGAPMTDLISLVDSGSRYGASLRQGLVDRVSRQLQLAFMVEVPADPSNRITVSPDFIDALGNMRPVLTYDIPEYTMRGVAYARQLSKRIFARLGAEDHTAYNPNFWGYAVHDGEGYEIRGGNHLAGTHVMGRDRTTSVVDADQRCWDYGNLYMVGGGSMPTVGTSNVTLTIAALCLRSARAMLARLDSETAPVNVTSNRRDAAPTSGKAAW